MDGQAEAATQASARAHPALRFCAWWAAWLLTWALLVCVFDAAVDPYLVIGAPRVRGFNAAKPETGTHTALAKDHLIARMRPAGLLLGDSKVDIGLDPDSPSWPSDARPAFNDGIPSLGAEGVLVRLRRDAEAGPVRRVLVSLDLQNLVLPAPEPTAADQADAAPAETAGGARDLLLATLSLDGLRASLATVAAQSRRDAVDISAAGSTGEGGFRAAAGREGYDVLFVHKDAELARRFDYLASSLTAEGRPASRGMLTVASMIAFCRERNIALDLVIPPVHADYLEALDRAGLWPLFERTKADLVRLAARSGDETLRLWDFGGYDAYSTEAVPPPSDLRGSMRWFWEPTHFTKALGEKVLAAIYGAQDGFGARLTPETIEAHLLADESAKAAYEASGAGSRERLDRSAR